VDCSGFVQAVLALHGCALPRDSDLQMRADEPVWRRARGRASAGGAADLLTVAREVLRPGDLLFFGGSADDGGGFGTEGESGARDGFGSGAEAITHVALHADDTLILHAAAGRGQVTRDDLAADDPLMERLRDRLLAVTRPLARTDGASAG
jgi:cell wall-associated NlpC family hydrolase